LRVQNRIQIQMRPWMLAETNHITEFKYYLACTRKGATYLPARMMTHLPVLRRRGIRLLIVYASTRLIRCRASRGRHSTTDYQTDSFDLVRQLAGSEKSKKIIIQ